jgi:hypothetical protein
MTLKELADKLESIDVDVAISVRAWPRAEVCKEIRTQPKESPAWLKPKRGYRHLGLGSRKATGRSN